MLCYYIRIIMRNTCPPPSLANPDSPCSTIVLEMGMPFFQKLQEHCGGREVKFSQTPGRMADDHRAVVTLGREDAERLGALMCGEQFYVPRGYRDFTNHLKVREAIKTGIGTQDIASNIGVSARQVRRLKQRLRDIAARSNRVNPTVMRAVMAAE